MPTDSRPPGDLDQVDVRAAEEADLAAIAEVHLAARAAAVPQMPALVHSPDEVRRHVRGFDLTAGERRAWVAETAGSVVGYAVVAGDWLDDLYVDPAHQGQGIGSLLLDVVKAGQPSGFCLWVFTSNLPARRFYARHGVVELDSTDGSGNEEGAPDVRLAWPGTDPLAFLRRLVDDVDAGLGELLNRRAALTRVIQQVKESPHRDPAREAEVAARVATYAPGLGAERVGRILDTVIAESLAAAAETP